MTSHSPRPVQHATSQPRVCALGLPEHISACLFDLDGVLTDTARTHAAAWKETFDAYLQARAEGMHQPYLPFASVADYDAYVDGKPRADGVRSFLAARGIALPEGHADDPPGFLTVNGLANRKNEIVLRLLHADGVTVYPGSLRYLRAVGAAGLHRAVVSSSRNTRAVLAAASIQDEVEVCIDGVVAARDGLPGKPAPDTYLAAARVLGVPPFEAAVFEDALAGVEAGRAGRFGFVVGVDRVGQTAALRQHGADIVVADLAELLAEP